MRAGAIWTRALSTTALSPVWLAPLALALWPVAAAGQELPTGGSVAAGSATISAPGPQRMQVDQTSQRSVINWQSFSVGQGAEVRFNQPGRDAAVLNRVTGGLGSRIDGSIAANGHVYLVNPRGVVVGPTGRVNAQGFVASSLQIDDDDFMGGDLSFAGTGASAAVENHGAISVGHGGYAALLGGKVVNTGTIVAPMGRIGFGAGERAVLDLTGDGFLQIAMPSQTDEEVLIEQAGRVSADGGMVEISAATAREAARRVVNLSGVTEARSVSGRNGRIVLGGGAGGTVRVTGRVSTAPRSSASLVERTSRPAARPSVEITGRGIELAGAEIDASRPGGGSVRIGGDFAGGGDLPRADTVSVDAGTFIDVSAIGAGAGGEVAIWSDAETRFFGAIDARGAAGAPGGFVEVSSAERLTFDSAEVQVGPGGTLWLDPANFEICVLAECGGFGSQVTPVSLTSIIDGGGLATVDTASADVPGDSGRITVSSEVSSAGTGTLELLADEDILINAPIRLPNGTLELSAAQEIFPGTGVNSGDVDVGTFRLFGGSWRQLNGTINASFEATDFSFAPGADFYRVETAEPLGSAPLVVTDVYGLQGMGSASGLGFDWVIGADIDASGTANWNDFGSGPEGFVPIGAGGSPFTGTLDATNPGGGVFSVTGLTTSFPSPEGAGMFGQTLGASIGNVSLINLSAAFSETLVGGLIGFAQDTDLSNVSVTGSVSTSGIVFGGEGPLSFALGGVAGEFRGGSMSNVSFDGSVSAAGFEDQTHDVGGVVGLVSGATGQIDGIRGGTNSGLDVVVDGDGDGHIGGIFGRIATSVDIGFTNVQGDTSVTVDLIDAPASFLADGNADIGGIVGTIASASGSFEIRPSTTTAVVADLTQASDIGADANIGGLVGLIDASDFDMSQPATTDVTVSTTGFVTSHTGGGAGRIGAGGEIFVTQPYGPLTSTVTVQAEEDAYVGGAVGTNEASFVNLDVNAEVNATAADPFMELFVGGAVGWNRGVVRTSYVNTDVSAFGTGDFSLGGYAGVNDVGGTLETVEAGFDTPSTVSLGSDASPAQPSAAAVGGLAGASLGTIQSGVADSILSIVAQAPPGPLEGSSIMSVGGLVGAQSGTTTSSDAFGTTLLDLVGLGGYAGGFVGAIAGDSTISASETSVDVSVSSNYQVDAGGFAGALINTDLAPTISDSRAFGSATFTETPELRQATPGTTTVGGFAGLNEGTLSRTSAFGDVTATMLTLASDAGGHTGANAATIANSYARGDVVSTGGSGFSTAGGVAGFNFGSIENAIATGGLSGTGAVGGAVGSNSVGGSLPFAGVYWDTDTSGVPTSDGGTGLTTAELQDTALFLGTAPYDFATVWSPGTLDDGGIYPQIYTIDPVVFATPDPVSVPYGEDPTPFSGTFAGGPPRYVFGSPTDTLDADTVFAGLAVPGTEAGNYVFGGTSLADAGSVTYTVIYAPATFDVTALPLEITALDQSAIYGDAFTLDETEGVGWELTSGTLVPGDSIDAVDLASPGALPAAEAGLYDITIESVTGTGVNNYEIQQVDAIADPLTDRGLRIDLRPLTVTALDQSYVYGDPFVLDETQGTGWDITAGSLVPGDSVDAVDLASAGEAPGVDAGAYPITVQGVTGTRLNNYDVTTVPGTLTVDQRPLEISAFDQTKQANDDTFTLDESRPASWDITGGTLVAGDSVDAVDLTSAGEAPGAAPGSYEIGNAGIDGVGLANYAITFVPGTLTVQSITLTIAALDQTKTYKEDGFVLDETAFSVSGLEAGDSVDTVSLSSPGEAFDADAGVYTITITGADGVGLDSYEITFEDGFLTVTPAPLTVTALDQIAEPQPDGIDLGTTAFSVEGLRPGDSVDAVQLASDGSTPGTFEIVPSDATGAGLVGASGPNYTITYVPGVLTINGFPLTITAGDQSKVYNDTGFALDPGAFTVDGLREGDSVESVVLTSDGEAVGAPVLDYAIVPSAAAGTGLENYLITYENGVLTVTPGELIIAAGDQQKVYGAPGFSLDPGAFSVSGLVAGDSVDAVTLRSEGTALSAVVDTYDIVPSAPVGSGLDNYVPVFQPGTLSVTPAPLTITPRDQTKPEGTDFAFAGTEFVTAGLRPVNDDAVTVVELTSEAAGTGGTAAGSPFPIFAANPQGRGLENYAIATGIGAFTVTEREGIDPEDVPDVIIPPQLPGLPNFTGPDAILVGLPGETSAASTGIATATGEAGGAGQQSLQVAESALATITRASDSLSVTAAACRETEGQVTEFLGCVSDALDAFSATLDPAQLDLAPELSGVSSAVIVARQRIDAARIRATQRLAGTTDPAERRAIEREAVGEARAALADAAAEISAAITLIRADDPELEGVFQAQGEAVLTAVSSVDLELQRAVGL